MNGVRLSRSGVVYRTKGVVWALSAIMALPALPGRVEAEIVKYAFIVDSGDWATASNWDKGSPPTNGGRNLVYIGSTGEGRTKGTATCIVSQAGAVCDYMQSIGDMASDFGTLIVTNAAASLVVGATFTMGRNAGSRGEVYQYAGIVSNGGVFDIAMAGQGAYRQFGGTHCMGGDFETGTGAGTYELARGRLECAGDEYIGHNGGECTFTQSGGTNVCSKICRIGQGAASRATYNHWGGDLPATVLVGVSGGSGILNMSNTTINSTTLVIRNDVSSMGTLHGYGTVPSVRMDGRTVADGYGNATDQTLTLSYLSVKEATYTYTSTHGWFAQNHGRLLLPTKAFANPMCWGEGNTDANWAQSPGGVNAPLVNAVKFDFTGGSGDLTGALLASDHGSVSNGVHKPVSVWDFNGPSGFGTCTLTIRYDDLKAASLGLVESELRVYQQVAGRWRDITTGSVDTARKQITASALSPLSQIAVFRPPRGTTILIH
ncbi:MAG: hypothetical protein PHR35_03360 [Kiritimatiellae bacterium]|nr:hypothetical protein [Kiritimatiellia bacterium]